jgi:hypothetical protein
MKGNLNCHRIGHGKASRLASVSLTVTIVLKNKLSKNKKAAIGSLHLIPILEDSSDAPLHSIFTFLTEIACDHIFATWSTDTVQRRFTMSDGDNASIPLKERG